MIAICIGHSRKINGRYEGGAYSPTLNINERDFNLKVASRLGDLLCSDGVESVVFDDYKGNGYGAAMVDAARQVKGAKSSLAIELHFNSASPSATGHEWLYWHTSEAGRQAAGKFDAEFSKAFPSMKRRGLKAITRKDRGSKFLELTHCPALILEPFFGSNARDCNEIDIERLAGAYAKAIKQV